MSKVEIIKQACAIVGSQAELARRVGVRPQMITNWMDGKRVTAERAVAIEKATGGKVTRQELRPDLFGEAAA